MDAGGDVRVDEAEVFTDFHVEAPANLAGDDLAAAIGEGTRADGDHLWVAEAAVRNWASGRTTDDGGAWDAGFSGMVEYARSKGWTDPAGTHLRAHVVHVD